MGPIPRQQIVEPAHGVAVCHALEHVFKVGERLDIVEFGSGDEGADGAPADATAI